MNFLGVGGGALFVFLFLFFFFSFFFVRQFLCSYLLFSCLLEKETKNPNAFNFRIMKIFHKKNGDYNRTEVTAGEERDGHLQRCFHHTSSTQNSELGHFPGYRSMHFKDNS